MAGARRIAVIAAAFLLLTEAWATAESPPQHKLPTGTAVVFVTDAPLDAGRREGSVVSVHLRESLALDGVLLAPAGAKADLVLGGLPGPNGVRRPVYTIERFKTSAGLMPVRLSRTVTAPLASGSEIVATTQAEVDHLGDRVSIRIPFPFALGGDVPASAYTPTPARTAPPFTSNVRGRRGSPSPSPTVAPTTSPTGAPSTAPSPAPSASP